MTAFQPALRADLLRGRTAWITGGGTGLGRAMALRFAALGADISLSGRRREPLESVAKEIEAVGRRAAFATCDVRDAAQVDQALDLVAASLTLLPALLGFAGQRIELTRWRGLVAAMLIALGVAMLLSR